MPLSKQTQQTTIGTHAILYRRQVTALKKLANKNKRLNRKDQEGRPDNVSAILRLAAQDWLDKQ